MPGPWSISAVAGGHGTITPSGNVSVVNGATQGFIITADPNYVLSAVTVDGNPVAVLPSYTFTNVVTNHSITAGFAPTPPVITSKLAVSSDINVPFTYVITSTPDGGGTAADVFEATTPLPPGLTINGSGVISGTPTTPGVTTVTLRIRSPNSGWSYSNLVITITPPIEKVYNDIITNLKANTTGSGTQVGIGKVIWSLSTRVSYIDGSMKEVMVMQDFGPTRLVNISGIPDFEFLYDICKTPAFKAFLTSLGYLPGAGVPPATINSYQFKFMAIVTIGGNVLTAGSDNGTPVLESDNLPVVLAALKAEPIFDEIFTSLAI